MTPFLLLSFVIALLTISWLTRPLWQRSGAAPARFDEVAPAAPAARPLALIGGMAGGVLAVLGIGYALIGAPEHVEVAPARQVSALADSRRAATLPAPLDPALVQAESRVNAMIEGLAERLKTHPDDADGWRTLARSYAALGRHAAAVDAFKSAVRLHPDEPALLAEYAFSAAVLDPYAASGEAARLIERALQLDPLNPKALALAGTLALDRKDYPGAIAHWEQLARIEPADGPIAKQLQFSVLQARQLAGARGGIVPAGLQSDSAARVGGTVTLAPALRARVSPNDTVYVFARAAKVGNGPRMPLAVLRRQVKDLPLRFTLDDSLAMSPGARLSSADRVVVGARIARAGGAQARDGDLQGVLPETALGRDDLKLEINEVVKLH
ncbi:MAG: tetratricopeptide repeat protein [Burkholderiales bacterium]